METRTEVERRVHRVGVGILEIVPEDAERPEDRSLRFLKDNLRDRVCVLLLAIIVAAQAADIATTVRALASRSYFENNPLLRALIVRSPVAAYTVKALMIFAIVLLVLSRLRGRRTQVALMIAASISLAAPLLNISLLLHS